MFLNPVLPDYAMLFFTEEKKRPGRKRKKKKKPGNWLTRNVFKPFSLFCLMVIVAIVVVTPRLGSFLPDLKTQERYQFSERWQSLVPVLVAQKIGGYS